MRLTIPVVDCVSSNHPVAVISHSQISYTLDSGRPLGRMVSGVSRRLSRAIRSSPASFQKILSRNEITQNWHVERVLVRRLDRSAPNDDQLHRHRRPNKHLLNPPKIQRYQTRCEQVRGLNVLGNDFSKSIDSFLTPFHCPTLSLPGEL